ncbi:hypothetical protein BROUX41_006710 [Berkeleyomyces rouxiae]|uniref:uncharacterized protein n=1 Tax=Berkeleyomyces rouxiae TaxID=2035830 RepID=UPI003B7D97F2
MSRLAYVDYGSSSLPSLSSAVPEDQHMNHYPRDHNSYAARQRYGKPACSPRRHRSPPGATRPEPRADSSADARPRTPMFTTIGPQLGFDSNYMASTAGSSVPASAPAYGNVPFTSMAPWMQPALSSPAVSAPMDMTMGSSLPTSMAFSDHQDSYVFSNLMSPHSNSTLAAISNTQSISPQSLSPEEAFLGMPDVNSNNMVLFDDSARSNYSHSPGSQSGQLALLSLEPSSVVHGSSSQNHHYQQPQAHMHAKSHAQAKAHGQLQPLPQMSAFENKMMADQNRDKTFSCTYSHCPERFNTTEELQIHKKEAHRSGNSKPDVTQKGPYVCLRLNPNTGRSCGSQFNRPYDLTRHEATIHCLDREKFCCPVCPDKTFSRFDALTRHYGHVHPNLASPVKNKERKTHGRRASKNNIRHSRRESQDASAAASKAPAAPGPVVQSSVHVAASAEAPGSWY